MKGTSSYQSPQYVAITHRRQTGDRLYSSDEWDSDDPDGYMMGLTYGPVSRMCCCRRSVTLYGACRFMPALSGELCLLYGSILCLLYRSVVLSLHRSITYGPVRLGSDAPPFIDRWVVCHHETKAYHPPVYPQHDSHPFCGP